MFLHGAGTRGNDVEAFPFIAVAPLCSENTWFDIFKTLIEFVGMLTGKDYVDLNRVYLMGASMGGYATCQPGMSMPGCFAAIAPICGGL